MMLFKLGKCFCFIISILILSYVTVIDGSKKCHSFYENTKYYLGTKTPYSYTANYNDEPIVYDGCTPVRLWALIRHGTRNPGKVAEKMRIHLSGLKMLLIDHHESGKGSLCPDVVDKLRSWGPTVDPSEHKFLTHEGEEEMLLLGERFINRFPDLLPEDYSNKSYKFRHTATQRTKESSQYFTTGMFGRRQKAHVWYPEPLTKDPILRFYKLCEKWSVSVDKNVSALAEVERFQTSPLVNHMLDNISQRIGLHMRMKFQDAKLIYQTCGFETAWNPKTLSPWCGVLSENDLEILEFSEDLKYYWIDGYGYTLTYEQACVALTDMIRHLTQKDYPPYTFYFSHSGTMLKMLAHLGLYKDPQQLSPDLFNKSRLWRTSAIDVFGSNLAFINFKCKDGYKVLTLHQERPATLPPCPEGDLCPIEDLLRWYKKSIDCDFKKICELD